MDKDHTIKNRKYKVKQLMKRTIHSKKDTKKKPRIPLKEAFEKTQIRSKKLAKIRSNETHRKIGKNRFIKVGKNTFIKKIPKTNRRNKSTVTPQKKEIISNKNAARNKINEIDTIITNENKCNICKTRIQNTDFKPCGHKACWRCGIQWLHALCPLCKNPRTRITEIIKTTDAKEPQSLKKSKFILFSSLFFDEGNIP